MKKLETERLIIRNYHENDWQDMYEYFSDAKVLEFEPYLPFSEEQCKTACKKRAEGQCHLVNGNLRVEYVEIHTLLFFMK